MQKKEDPYGLHRVLKPEGVFPQAAEILDVSLPIAENEALVRVDLLNIDSASFHQLWTSVNHDTERMKKIIMDVVRQRGKMHNPTTNSGGMLLGTVEQVGDKLSGHAKLTQGDRIATLVSLTLTPLHLDKIHQVHISSEQVEVSGYAILFESSMAHRIPKDLPENISLSVMDVCGAPALTSHLCHVGEVVVILGAGKAGLLVAAEARKKLGRSGKVIVLEKNSAAVEAAKKLSFVDHVLEVDLQNPRQTREIVLQETQAKMADLVVNCVNVSGTEMASLLSAKRTGTVLFFNMATSFQTAVLGAEGIGHETRLIMGNGYYPGHADMALGLVRENLELKNWFENRMSLS